jgi:hypothetical protein
MQLPNGYRWLYVNIEARVIQFLLEEVTDPATREHLRNTLADESGAELDVTKLSPEGRQQVLHALAERLVPAAITWYAEDPYQGGSVGTMKQLWLMAEDVLRQEGDVS